MKLNLPNDEKKTPRPSLSQSNWIMLDEGFKLKLFPYHNGLYSFQDKENGFP